MYWFPREARTMNRLVWSDYDLAVLELTLIMEARMLLERYYCLGWTSSRKA